MTPDVATMEPMAEHTADHRRALWEKIKDVKYCMLTTWDRQLNALRSRPMTNQEVEFDGTLWFFTSTASGVSHEIENDGNVNLSYADIDKNRYVSVSGVAKRCHDKAKAEALWNPMYKIFFPGGLDDPTLELIEVHVHCAEYWDSKAGKMLQMLQMAKAAVTGKSAFDLGEHAKLEV